MRSEPSPLICWSTRFNTGHEIIDAQHRGLVDLLNRFAADIVQQGGEHTHLFDLFKDALRTHFAYEEAALRQMGIGARLLDAHEVHHGESLLLIEGLGQQLAVDPREYSAAVLAEVSHCLLVDLLDEDRFLFVTAATQADAAGAPPVAPALHTFGRLVDLLNDHHERIAQARDYYLTLLDDFPTPVCRADANGRFDWFNRTWMSLTGTNIDDAIADRWIDSIHAEDRDGFLQRWQESFAARIPLAIEYRLRDASGAWCWMHHIGHPFFDGAGEFLGYIATLFDLTERRRAEASLRVSAEVFEHATEAIMITDADGRIEAVNPAFTRITGYTADEAIGKSANLMRSGFHDDNFYRQMWKTTVEQGSWQGEIVNRHKSGEIFPAWLSISVVRNGGGRISRMVGILNSMAALRASQDHLLHLAHHDTLTGLPNRLLFGARAQHSLERCTREGSRLAILFVDLDNFKPVNDRLGHKAGDELLRDIAARFTNALRAEDTVARFGGDEFVILAERAESMADANSVAEKLLALFPITVADGDSQLTIGASIGVALYPESGQTVDELIEAADQAMYRAKREKPHRAADIERRSDKG